MQNRTSILTVILLSVSFFSSEALDSISLFDVNKWSQNSSECFCVGIDKKMPNGKKEIIRRQVCGYKYHSDAVRATRQELEEIYDGTGIKVEVYPVADYFCKD